MRWSKNGSKRILIAIRAYLTKQTKNPNKLLKFTPKGTRKTKAKAKSSRIKEIIKFITEIKRLKNNKKDQQSIRSDSL